MSESSWIDRARQGDGAAWDALVRDHQEAAFRLAYLILGDADDAEDAAQEAFIRAYRALARFDATRPFRPWLLRITANLARNRQRSIGRYLAAVGRFSQSTERVVPAPDGNGQPDAWQTRALWEAVRRLSQKEQEVIYLRYFLDLPVAETAEALGIAPGTVKSRLHRALDHLRTVVEREFPALQEERVG